jgi:UDP-N-acetylglucosamine 2-epimerase
MKIFLVVGTRSQLIKSAPIINQSLKEKNFILDIVHTGQHYDYGMSKIFLENFELPPPIVNLGVRSASHGEQTGKMLIGLETTFLKYKPDIVMVPGDTNSTLAGAIAATKLNIPLVHIESGARSYDMSMPEEINRRLTDHCSDRLFTVSENCSNNLIKEGIEGDKIYLIGDTMYDVLNMKKNEIDSSDILDTLNLIPKEYIIVTAHRQENVDSKYKLKEIIHALSEIDKKIIFPIHPRTKSRMKEFNLSYIIQGSENIIITDPLPYHDLQRLVRDVSIVITDSGGLQKEAYWLKIPCITIRTTTEWIETLEKGVNTLVDANRKVIVETAQRYLEEGIDPKRFEINPYSRGNASEEIFKFLNLFMSK